MNKYEKEDVIAMEEHLFFMIDKNITTALVLGLLIGFVPKDKLEQTPFEVTSKGADNYKLLDAFNNTNIKYCGTEIPMFLFEEE